MGSWRESRRPLPGDVRLDWPGEHGFLLTYDTSSGRLRSADITFSVVDDFYSWAGTSPLVPFSWKLPAATFSSATSPLPPEMEMVSAPASRRNTPPLEVSRERVCAAAPETEVSPLVVLTQIRSSATFSSTTLTNVESIHINWIGGNVAVRGYDGEAIRIQQYADELLTENQKVCPVLEEASAHPSSCKMRLAMVSTSSILATASSSLMPSSMRSISISA